MRPLREEDQDSASRSQRSARE